MFDPALVSRLYEVAIEPNGLEEMSILVRQMLDIDSAGFWLIRDGAVVEITNTPDIQASEPAYLARYQTMDPWAVRDPALFGTVTLGNELFDERALVKTEFYQDFARHYGMFRPMGVTLNLENGMLAAVAANRIGSDQLLGQDDKVRMQALVVHLAAALRLRLRFGALRAVVGIREDALDALAFPLAICDADGAVFFANRAMRMAAGSRTAPLALRGERLDVTQAGDRTAFRDALARAARGESTGVKLTDPHGEAVPLTVTPASDRVASEAGRVAVSLPAPRLHDPVRTMEQIYGLTPAQADLCRALQRGETLEEAARRKGIAVSTMRTHLKTILAKTEAANLRDLLRIMASLPHVDRARQIEPESV